MTQYANVAELVDALDLGSSGATRESSSLSLRSLIYGQSRRSVHKSPGDL